MRTLAPFVAFLLQASPAIAGVIPVADAQQRNLGIEVTGVHYANAVPVIALPATVGPAPTGRSAVTAPFAGVVTRTLVVDGQQVMQGQPLLCLFSQEALAAQAKERQAAAELDLAKTEADRMKRLVDEGIEAPARLDAARSQAAQARARLDEQQRLRAVAPPDAQGMPGTYCIKAALDGRVSNYTAAVGAAVEPMESLMVIERTDRLWLDARLPAGSLGLVQTGDPVRAAGAEGEVVAVGASIDPQSRSAVLKAQLPGTAGLVPGRTVLMTVLHRVDRSDGRFVLPLAAVVQISGTDSVFVRRDGGFEPVPVNVTGRGADMLAVEAALSEGDAVAISGLSELKAMAISE